MRSIRARRTPRHRAAGGVVSRRRRAFVLAGLALLLGALAASDVAGREAALDHRLGPAVAVVVARGDLPAGRTVRSSDLAVRRVPARYAPAAAFADPAQAAGLRTTAAVVHGTDLVPAMLADGDGADGALLRPGERVADLVAAGPPQLVRPGGRVDVLVTRAGRDGETGSTSLALEDVEVLSASAAGDDSESGARKVQVSLRVTVRQAVYLAAAQAFAHDIRLLPRPPGERRAGASGLTITDRL
jgi:pilus assembly protein CpaB